MLLFLAKGARDKTRRIYHAQVYFLLALLSFFGDP